MALRLCFLIPSPALRLLSRFFISGGAMQFDSVIRGIDSHGSGVFGASRGSRKHKGIDVECVAGDEVCAVLGGKVTKIGYPYNPADKKKGHLRYVEVTRDGLRYRYFYVSAAVKVGDLIDEGQVIGTAQGLADIYPGIADHFHFEILHSNGDANDPSNYVKGG